MGKGKLSLSSHFYETMQKGRIRREDYLDLINIHRNIDKAVQMKMFVVLCARSQKMLNRSGMYPQMDLPWLLTTHLTTAVIMSSYKSRHKFKTRDA
jgi:hypothetical protein